MDWQPIGVTDGLAAIDTPLMRRPDPNIIKD
jgi:hypothetical protein